MGLSITPSNSVDQVNPVQYHLEGNVKTAPAEYGVLDTASPGFTAAGRNALLEAVSTPRFEDTRKAGSPSRVLRTKTKEAHRAVLVTQIVNDTLLKWAMLAPNGSGTCEESFTFLKSYYVNQTLTYEIFLGCLPEEGIIRVTNDGLLQLEIQMRCSDIYETQAANGGMTTPSLATDELSGTPWKADDGGSNRLQINSINYYEMGFSVQVSTKYSVTNPSENQKDLHARPVVQDVRGSIDVVRSSLVISNDSLAGTARNIVIVLKAATSTMTLASCVFDDRRGPKHDPNDTTTLTEPKSFTGPTVAIA